MKSIKLQKQTPEAFCEKRCSYKFRKFTGKHLRWSLFLIKWEAFWSAALLKETLTQALTCEYSKKFQNNQFEVETLENEIYSCFFMSDVIHSLLSEVKYTETLFSKRNMAQCKILIQLILSLKQRSLYPYQIWLVKLT